MVGPTARFKSLINENILFSIDFLGHEKIGDYVLELAFRALIFLKKKNYFSCFFLAKSVTTFYSRTYILVLT